ncbi:MAG: ABC transporter substrate-binding protein [Thermoleophilia bacterium]|nr:ABC transporter substrate-binding protein [Thermoleophilia bacterium]
MTQTEESELRDTIEQYRNARLTRRDFVQRAAVLGISASVAASILAACGGGGGGGGTTTGEEGQPVQGGVLRMGYDRAFQKLDNVVGPWADEPFTAIYEVPIIRDPGGKFVSSVAEAWEFSSDGLTLSMKIREGLKFHSGAPLTAANVAEDFNIFRTTGVTANFWAPVKNVEEGENNSVVLTLSKTNYGLIETISTLFQSIHNEASRKAAGEGWGATTVDATGPFTLKTFKPASEVVVERWPDYPGSGVPFVTNKGPAYLDSIRWVPILEPANRANEIETGSVDIVKSPAAQDISRLQSNDDLVVLELQELSNYFITIDRTRGALGQPGVAQAMSHAIDRQALVDTVFFGHAVPTYGPIFPAYRWYDPGVEAYNEYDPDKARDLLKSAGLSELRFTLLTQNQPIQVQVLEAVGGMLREVGITMEVKAVEDAAFFPDMFAGKPDAFMFKWLWESPTDNMRFFGRVPSWDYNGNPPKSMAGIDAWESAATEEQLEKACRQVQLAWAEELPFIPLVTQSLVWVHHKRVHNFRPTQTSIYPLFNDVWIEA